MRSRFAGVEIAPPPGWLDITDDHEGSPPTLARDDGVGAIQFSVALYQSGARPGINEAVLRDMLGSRLAALKGNFPIATEQSHPCVVVGAEGLMDTDALGAWYISDGDNVAFVTYVGEAALGGSKAELEDARAIAHSLRFP